MDAERIRAAINDAARARRAGRRTVTVAGVTALVAVAGVVSAVAWVGKQPSPTKPARSAGPHYISFSRVVLRAGALDITFTGGDPALRPGDRCYESYSTTTEPGDRPDEIVVRIRVDYASPSPHPTRGPHTVCDSLGHVRHTLVPVDREYTVVVDGSTSIRHAVGKDGAGPPTESTIRYFSRSADERGDAIGHSAPMRLTSLVLAGAVAVAALATAAPADAAFCVPATRLCVITHCDYDPDTGYIHCD